MHRVPLFLIISAALMSLTSADADTTRPITLSERARGAQRIVVGRVVGSTASRERNSYGDDLIVSRFTLRVEEALKGGTVTEALVDVEGGTLGGLTLRVSDLPQMVTGDRAVFFLDPKPQAPGVDVPHLRGLGILKLDAENRVPHSSLTLDQIRAAVQTPAR